MPDTPDDRRGSARTARWVYGLDVLTILLLIGAVFVLVEGGVVVQWAEVRISIRSAWRLFAWSAGVAALRHALCRRPAIHEVLWGGLRAAFRPRRLLADDLESLGRATVEASRPAWRRLRGAAGVLLLYAALTAIMTYPQVRQMHGVSIDTGDPLFSTWRLSWFAHQLPRDPAHLFDANIFYPEPRTLAFSDAMLVPSLMAAPLVWLGVHQLTACNLLLLAGFALSGASMFLLVRSLTGHVGAALFAGFVFAFLPFRFMHYAHLELQMSLWMPLCLWAFHKCVAHGRLRDGLLTGLFLVLQTLSSWYYGIFFATFLIPVAGAVLVGTGWTRARRALVPLLAGALLAAALIAPFSVPYFKARQSLGERPVSEIQFYSATPANYLAAHPRNALLGSITAQWGGQERELFQGIAVPIIALAGLWPPLSAARIGYALGLVLAFEASLGLNGVVYPWLHDHVLPYRGLRVPARMAMIVGLTLAILGGYGVARMCTALRARRAAVLACIFLMLLVFSEYRSTLTLRNIWDEPPPVYAALPATHPSVLLNLPLLVPDVAFEPAYMYFSTWRWDTLVNGYSGYSPRSYSRLLDVMHDFPTDAAVDELRRRRVEFILVHGAFMRVGQYQQLVARLDARQELRLVGTSRWEGRETRLYEMRARP